MSELDDIDSQIKELRLQINPLMIKHDELIMKRKRIVDAPDVSPLKLKVGDVVKFKNAEEMTLLEEKKKVRCGWHPAMEYLCGKKRTITEDILKKIECGIDVIWVETGKQDNKWLISIDMIELVN